MQERSRVHGLSPGVFVGSLVRVWASGLTWA